MNPARFFAELKRRNVYKVAVAYAVVGWLLIQIATQVFPFFEIPNWAVRLVVLVIVVGFPIALVLAWAFELTPEGIRREGCDRFKWRRETENRIHLRTVDLRRPDQYFALHRLVFIRTLYRAQNIFDRCFGSSQVDRGIAV